MWIESESITWTSHWQFPCGTARRFWTAVSSTSTTWSRRIRASRDRSRLAEPHAFCFLRWKRGRSARWARQQRRRLQSEPGRQGIWLPYGNDRSNTSKSSWSSMCRSYAGRWAGWRGRMRRTLSAWSRRAGPRPRGKSQLLWVRVADVFACVLNGIRPYEHRPIEFKLAGKDSIDPDCRLPSMRSMAAMPRDGGHWADAGQWALSAITRRPRTSAYGRATSAIARSVLAAASNRRQTMDSSPQRKRKPSVLSLRSGRELKADMGGESVATIGGAPSNDCSSISQQARVCWRVL